MQQIEVLENEFITLSDGCKLAAKMWFPSISPNQPEEKVPAILEYLPYRKRDGTAIRDQLTHPYLAAHDLVPFEKPESAPPLKLTYLRPCSGTRYINRDLNGFVTYSVVEDSGHYIMDDNGLEIDYIQKENFTIRDDDPLSAKLDIETVIHIARGHWKTCTETKSSMTANKSEFQLNASVNAYENNQLVLTKTWSDKIPRKTDALNLPESNDQVSFFHRKRQRDLGVPEACVGEVLEM